MVTVRVPEPPCVILKVPGNKLVTVGGWGVAITVLVAVPPFNETAIDVDPSPTAVTGTGTDDCPAANAMDAGTVATPVFVLLAVRVPATVGVGARVAVRFPADPTVMVNGSGERSVGVGRMAVPKTLIVRNPPVWLATFTSRVLVGLSEIVRSTINTF